MIWGFCWNDKYYNETLAVLVETVDGVRKVSNLLVVR